MVVARVVCLWEVGEMYMVVALVEGVGITLQHPEVRLRRVPETPARAVCVRESSAIVDSKRRSAV